ncbi:MAG: ferric-dicitrate binding protein FerR (iron transport regulator) [Verrucomicrobiales bacterium]
MIAFSAHSPNKPHQNKVDSELENLTQAYVNGTLKGEQIERLNGLLLDDEQARRAFAEALNLDSAIAASVEGWKLEQRREPEHLANPSVTRWKHWLGLAACLALVASVGSLWLDRQHHFATVERDVGVESLNAGTRLGGQSYSIVAGTIELLTEHGARVIIEAPAEFHFESAQHLYMTRGRLSADVPPEAIGFTVTTPSGEAVDLGTRFGVDIPESGASEIHVFEGEVIAKARGTTEEQSLRAGDALAMRQGISVARDLRSSAFIQSDEMNALSEGSSTKQGALSDAALRALRADPAAIAILDFESGHPHPGTYRTVQGRWPGTRAPEFIHSGDHLKLNVGGEQDWPQLTLAAWVRLDRLGAPYQSLFHADGWDNENFGLTHWMVNEATTMRFATWGNVLSGGGEKPYPDSHTPVLADQGRWVHLAVVYDSKSGTVRFYHNGRFDNELHQSTAHPAKLGPAQIGNWNEAERKLSGRVDELIILGRTMNDAEIFALFDAGNPYR